MDRNTHYINGQWLASDAVTPNINPSDIKDIIGDFSTGDKTVVKRTVHAAQSAAFAWAASTPQQRFDILDRIGTEIVERKIELGRLLSREEGKTLPEGIGEVNRAGQIFKYYAGEALRITGEKLASIRPGVSVEITREPIGVVGLITPWNFPFAIPAWKIAPALAYGNTVILKPAELTPGCACALADIIDRSGLPEGVFNLVLGTGPDVGEVLVNHPDVAAISFTGSIATGQRIAEKCVARQAKVQLEMGGKNPLVILDDAEIETAVNCAANGAFFSTGQRCTASSRLIVTEGIHDRFVEALTEKMKSLRVGHALKETTQIGPVVDEAQLL
ncbi:MAG: aldehyde dehydrogenase family protein, partial [Calditrichota bacterium]